MVLGGGVGRAGEGKGSNQQPIKCVHVRLYNKGPSFLVPGGDSCELTPVAITAVPAACGALRRHARDEKMSKVVLFQNWRFGNRKDLRGGGFST